MFSRANSRLWLIPILFLIGVFYRCAISLAETPQEYYGRLFSSAGFKHIVPYTHDLLEEPLPSMDWLLVLSEDLPGLPLEDVSVLPEEGTILVCTASYAANGFRCSSDSLSLLSSEGREIPLVKDYPSLGLITFKSRKLFVVPESLLFTPASRKALVAFLNEYTRSLKPAPTYITPFSQLVTPFNAWVLQFFSYSLWGIAISVILYGFWVRLSSVDASQIFPTCYRRLKDFYIRLISFARRYHFVLGLFLLLSLMTLLVFSSLLSVDILSMLRADLLYAFLISLKQKDIAVLASGLSPRRLVLFGFLGFYGVAFLLYMLPLAELLGDFLLETFVRSKTPKRCATLSPYAFVAFALIALFFSLLASLPVLLPILFVFLLLLLYVTRVCKIRLGLPHLVVFYCVSLILLLVSVPLRRSLEARDSLFRRSIFGRVSPIILLPYEKTFSPVEHFSSFKVEDFAYPLFLDQWTIYYPGVSSITTWDISEFGRSQDSPSYLILGMSRSGFVKAVLNNEALRKAIASPDFSPSLYVQIRPVAHVPRLYASVLIDCSSNPPSGDLKIQPYTKFDASLYPRFNLLHFAGCSRDDVAEGTTKSFSVPLNLDLSLGLSQLLFVEGPEDLLISIDAFTIRDSLASNAPSVSAYFLRYAPKYKILLDHVIPNSSSLVVYANVPDSFKDSLPVHMVFNLPLDLGAIAEDLRTRNLLPNPFVIWSSFDGVIIRNSFVEY